MSRNSLAGAAILTGLAASILTGCAGNDAFPIMDQPQTDADKIPGPAGEVVDSSEFDLDSSRLSAITDGFDLYLIDPVGGNTGTPCLVVLGQATFTACGGGLPITVETGGGGDSFQLVTAPAQSGDGWTALSDNIRVRTDE